MHSLTRRSYRPLRLLTQYIPSDADKEQPAVLIYTSREKDESVMPEVEKTDIFHSFAIESTYAGLTGILPQNGMKAYGKSGPFHIYTSYHDAPTILESTGGATAVKVSTSTGDSVKIDFSLSARKIEDRPTSVSNSFTRDFLERQTVHIMIYLKSDWDHEYVTTTSVRDFIVFSCNRPSHKHEGVSIGKAGVGSIISPFHDRYHAPKVRAWRSCRSFGGPVLTGTCTGRPFISS